MKQNVTLYDFRDAFRTVDRDNNFSYEGLEALYGWLIGLEEDTGEEWELDVIALCCDFSEYKDLAEFQRDYSAEEYGSIEDIENETTVIRVGDEGFIIQGF
jgi:hypothetical protein